MIDFPFFLLSYLQYFIKPFGFELLMFFLYQSQSDMFIYWVIFLSTMISLQLSSKMLAYFITLLN